MVNKEIKVAIGMLIVAGATYGALNLGKGLVDCSETSAKEKPIVQKPTPTIIWPTPTSESLQKVQPTNTPGASVKDCLCPVNPFKVGDSCYGILAKGPGTQCLCSCPEGNKP